MMSLFIFSNFRNFFQVAEKLLRPCGLEVKCYDKTWITSKKMESFLSVAKGSVEPPVFLEMKYKRGKEKDQPIVLVGNISCIS